MEQEIAQALTLSESQFYLNCTNLTEEQLKNINLARGVSGFVCAMLAMLIICFLLYFKSYKSVLQRLFLWLTGVTVVLNLLAGLQIEHQFKYRGQERFCSALGFVIQWVLSMTYTFTLEILLVLVYTVYQKLKGDLITRVCTCTWVKVKLEIILIVTAIFLPLLYIWPPLRNGNYGLEIAYCWIKETDQDCNKTDISGQLQFFIISEAIECTSVLLTIGLAILYCGLAYRYRGVGTPQVLTLLSHTLLLMSFLVGHAIISAIALGIHSINNESYLLWLTTDAVAIPLLTLEIPCGFLVHLYAVRYSGKRKFYKRLVLHCCKCCRRWRRGNDVHEHNSQNGRTIQISEQINAPSETYWSTPYTNEFTSVAEIDSVSAEGVGDLEHIGERRLLVSAVCDKGYGSQAN